MPFSSEEIYQQLVKPKNYNAVHLEDWPKINKKAIDLELEKKMEFVRRISIMGLKIRKEKKIKVRQPLSELRILSVSKRAPKIEKPLLELISQELNIKKIIVSKIAPPRNKYWALEKDKDFKIALNLKISSALKEEGLIREFIRQVQEVRKKDGYKPHHKISIICWASDNLNKTLKKNRDFILSQIRAKDIECKKISKAVSGAAKEALINGEKVGLIIKKIS